MSKLITVTKLVSNLVVSAGVGAAVGNAIKSTTPEDVSTYKKISIGVGSFVLSGLVAGQATKYAAEQIDVTVEQLKELKDMLPKKS